VSGRAIAILGRFPAHLEAARPDKQLAVVAGALARDLDVDAAALAGIRRAHRLRDADHLRDVLLIAALHGISRAELALLFLRFQRASARLAALAAAAGDDERETAAAALTALWGIEAPHPRLPLFVPPDAGGGPPDPDAGHARLLVEAADALRHIRLLDGLRDRVGRICAIHAGGNGTVMALLNGVANALDLDIERVQHSPDRYWHAALVHDRLELARPVVEPGPPGEPDRVVSRPFGKADELLGIEENPLWRDETDKTGRKHGERFSLLRKGFERALLQVRVTGQESRTIGPMVVNRDEGHGIGFVGAVPAAETLVFVEEGRVSLQGGDVTALAYSWKGACFAGPDARPGFDFVFDGPGVGSAPVARFVETTPPGALDREAVFPHGGESIEMPGVGVGETRLAFFVQEGHFGLRDGADPPTNLAPTPRTTAAYFDNSVFAAGPAEALPVAAEVSLSWLEHRAFAVRIIIPSRFRAWEDDPEGADTRQRVAFAADRFRPAGVAVSVDFIEENWVLGQAVLGAAGSDDLIAQLRAGTALWPGPEPSN
jgi:hypothetical protein